MVAESVAAPDEPLTGLRIVECASFVAVPSCGLALSQLGADVIRIDPPGGASDINRWPLSTAGASLFWLGLNKGKRSVIIDYRVDAGRELLLDLATRPGPGAGILVDNLVGSRRPKYEELQARRADVIHVHLEGKPDGTPAVDYSVNAETGVPLMTGPQDSASPVNHVLPAWDMVAGAHLSTAVAAAALRRSLSGAGSRVDIALADVALAGVGSMGWLAEAEQRGEARSRHGNHMFGSFGVDFETKDHRRVMVVALTEGQWHALREVTETAGVFSALEPVLAANLELESDRYRLRETITAILRPWFAQRDFDEVTSLLDSAKVLWSPYLDMREVAARARASGSDLVTEIDDPRTGPLLSTGSPLRWDGQRASAVAAPLLGADTQAVLSDLLGLTSAEIGRLAADGVVVLDPG